MNPQKKSLRVGITAILCALMIRLGTSGLADPLWEFLHSADAAALLIRLETGVELREPEEPGFSLASLDYAPESPGPQLTENRLPSFQDSPPVEISYGCRYRPDLPALLKQPLSWNLRSETPTVLIYHTHATESYRKFLQDYQETAPFRTLDPHYNVVSIGARVAELLEEAGIPVIHDQQIHDYPSYNSAYYSSRQAAQAILKENPGILLALDIHRDAVEGPGGQIKTCANVGGSPSAQLMLVVGTDCRMAHRGWRENLSLALKLQVQLEKKHPGITRPLCLRPQRFNQDLSPGALLVEVGSAGNSHGEAMLAAQQLAEAIVSLAGGSATTDSGGSAADPPAEPPAGF